MTALSQDLRYGLRSLRRAPGFTLVAVLTLALGIGATSAIFSLVNGILLRPLEYTDADRIARITYFWQHTGSKTSSLSGPDFHDVRAQASHFETVSARRASKVDLMEALRYE